MKKITLFLLLLAAGFMQAQVPQSERDALIALYNATGGANWTHNDNWNTSNAVSSWHGVTVENINGADHVTGISLSWNNLNGTLPNEMGDLTYLKRINLQGNNISGTIPATLSGLTGLEYVLISWNHFSGTFPDLSGNTNLKSLYIAYNDFQFADLEPHFNAINNLIQSNNGTFWYVPMNPVDVELSYDVVYGNNYTFTMPTVNGTGVTYQWYRNDTIIPGATSQTYNITNAQHSDLGDYVCKASSPVIPDLTIDRNVIHLYGPVVQQDRDALIALYNSTDGANWWNNTNWLSTQPVYEWYGVKMRGDRVIEINLLYNNLNGTLPSEIGDLTELKSLNLSYNGPYYNSGDLHGSIPTEIGNLSKLKELIINFCNLTGNIPREIGSLIHLKKLELWYNQLSGSIPPEIGNLTNLEIFTVEDNPLTGNIPATLANLTKMRSFWIGNNQLTGDIPPGLFDNMPDLYYAAIYGNDVTGSIDLSNNTGTHGIWFNDTQISSLDLRNGNNQNIYYFYAQNNPNLTCIFVDDANNIPSTWTNIDAHTHFVETQAECDAFAVDEVFMSKISIFPNPFSNLLNINVSGEFSIEKITIQNMQGQTVYSGKFKTSLDLSGLSPGVYFLYIRNNQGQEALFKLMKQ